MNTMDEATLNLTKEINQIFDNQSITSNQISSSSFQTRKSKLEKLKNYIIEHQNEIEEALYKDLRKPKHEAILSEIIPVISEIRYVVKHLNRWMKPHQVPTLLSGIGSTSHILYEPKGKALLIAPWNYPFNLVLRPLIYAIAAGCTVIIKPSEFSPATNSAINQMIKTLFNPSEIVVLEGEVEVTQTLLKLPFNHIYFTGSTVVGKIVMKAAAENLSSVTLELGGKSPLIIDDSIDVEKTADKIVWAKFLNNGQTCVAPDYILVHTSKKQMLITALIASIKKMYNPDGNGIKYSDSYGRIINNKSHQRLQRLLEGALKKGAQIPFGGHHEAEGLFFEPTLLTNLEEQMDIMQEEIFGPLLPILSYSNLEEAVKLVQSKPKPLALYIMSNDRNNQDDLVKQISAGGVYINDFLQHFTNSVLPSGGINNSGIGKSNGFYGFQEFSNAKGVTKRRLGDLRILFPPYKTDGYQLKILNWLVKYI